MKWARQGMQSVRVSQSFFFRACPYISRSAKRPRLYSTNHELNGWMDSACWVWGGMASLAACANLQIGLSARKPKSRCRMNSGMEVGGRGNPIYKQSRVKCKRDQVEVLEMSYFGMVVFTTFLYVSVTTLNKKLIRSHGRRAAFMRGLEF